MCCLLLLTFVCISYWACRLVIFINLAFLLVLPLWAMPGVGLKTPTELYVCVEWFAVYLTINRQLSRRRHLRLSDRQCAVVFTLFARSFHSTRRRKVCHVVVALCARYQRCCSEFFAFFELTDKGTSFLGPITLAVMKETTGEVSCFIEQSQSTSLLIGARSRFDGAC